MQFAAIDFGLMERNFLGKEKNFEKHEYKEFDG